MAVLHRTLGSSSSAEPRKALGSVVRAMQCGDCANMKMVSCPFSCWRSRSWLNLHKLQRGREEAHNGLCAPSGLVECAVTSLGRHIQGCYAAAQRC